MKLLAEAVALFMVLVSGFARAISPNPDEGQRILPWPSWVWQRLSLFAIFPLAAVVLVASLPGRAWTGPAVAVGWAMLATYAGTATRWLRATGEASPAAKLAAGASVVVGWAVLIFVMATIIMCAVGLALFAVVGFVLARDIIRALLRKLG